MAEYVAKNPCKYCKQKHKKSVFPKVVELVEGLFYAQCTECDHYSQYQFCATTRNQAFKNWDDFMGCAAK